jgi:predicted NBD/HSP70 family sugar kinase/CRP-like cAMP-binding protein
VDVPGAGRDRHAQVRRLIGQMESAQLIDEGQFNALGMLVTDASLSADEPALEAAQDGLQWLYSRHEVLSEPDEDHVEQRGRLLGMIDVTHWALRRLPSALHVGVDPSSHAGRFLVAVAQRPGVSNQELAMQLGIDETEVSRVGRRLLAAGVVWRRKDWRRNAWDITPRGRDCLIDAKLVSADKEEPELEFAVGVKVLPHRLIGVIVDANAQLVADTVSRELGPAAGPAAQVAGVSELVRNLTAGALGPDEYQADRIGLGVELGGHVSADSGTVVFAPNYEPPGAWDGFPLSEKLQEATGLSAVIDNDVNVLAEYEYVFGGSKEPQSLVAIVLDEGIGCGLVADGRLIHGISGMAGEIGHIVVQPDGRECRCGKKGCLESEASTLAIPKVFDELTGRVASEASDFRTVIASVENDDKDAKEAAVAIGRAGNGLGLAISTVLNLINPEKLVLYGPAELVCESKYATAELFMSRVRQSSERYTFSSAYSDCTLDPKIYENESGARAAAAVALLRAKKSSTEHAQDALTASRPVTADSSHR